MNAEASGATPRGEAEPISIGVVGLGSAGLRHAENFSALGCHVLAFDTDERRAQLLDRLPDSRWMASLDELIAASDALVVATPPGSHVEIALEAASAGRHILVEKPLSNGMNGVDRLIEEVNEKGVVGSVGYNLRFLPALAKARDLITTGAIGRILTGWVHFGYDLSKWHPTVDHRKTYSASKSEGGVILDAIHELDYLIWMCGPAASVTAATTNTGHLDIESEEIAVAAVELASGGLVAVHLDYLSPEYRRAFRFSGTEGSISWEWGRGDLCFERKQARAELPFKTDIGRTYVDEARNFLEAMAGERKIMATLEEGEKSLELALALGESAASGVRVHLESGEKEA